MSTGDSLIPEPDNNQVNESTEDFYLLWDLEAKREEAYTELLTQAEKRRRNLHTHRQWMKTVFFVVVCLIMIFIVVMGCVTLFNISKTEARLVDQLGVVVASFGTIITSIIALPKIIAENLFPSKGEDNEMELIKTIIKMDIDKNIYDKEINDWGLDSTDLTE